MRYALVTLLMLGVTACASTPTPYGPADRVGANGFTQQQLEDDRFTVSYTDETAQRARDFALLRAAEVTLENGGEWFEVVRRYTDQDQGAFGQRGGGTSVSIGGSTGSSGRSSVGVGIGIGFPLGGGQPAETDATHVIEFRIGSGPKPDSANAYDAFSVSTSIPRV